LDLSINYQNVFKALLYEKLMEEKETKPEEQIPVSGEKKSEFTKSIRKNPWILSTIFLGIIVLIFIFLDFSGSLTGSAISSGAAATSLINFLNTQAPSAVVLENVSTISGLYNVNVIYQNQTIPLYVTKDGKYFIQGLVLLESTTSSSSTTQQEPVPKSDKPDVELYVFAYCPYGLQMEKAILPVVKLLGDKISFKIRQIGAMHGDFEEVEAKRQLCIEKNYPAQYLNYVSAFASSTDIGNCQGTASCVEPLINAIYAKLGINENTVNSCMTSDGATLYSAEEQNAQNNGVTGSPTLVINGVEAQASRNPEAVKEVICNAFNTVPSECSQTLDSSSASSGFGASTSSSSTSAQC